MLKPFRTKARNVGPLDAEPSESQARRVHEQPSLGAWLHAARKNETMSSYGRLFRTLPEQLGVSAKLGPAAMGHPYHTLPCGRRGERAAAGGFKDRVLDVHDFSGTASYWPPAGGMCTQLRCQRASTVGHLQVGIRAHTIFTAAWKEPCLILVL